MASNDLGRVFNPARYAQGFNSQADLDAFYAYHDHIDSCGGCIPSSGPGNVVQISLCPRALELQKEWDSHSRFRMIRA